MWSGMLLAVAWLPLAASHDPDYEDHEREIIILFMFGGMAIGTFVTHFLSRFPIKLPYTVVMFAIGVLLASLYTNEYLGHLGQSLDDWSRLDPELMLYLFLPVLIFGEAMTLKWHHVKGGFSQSLLLAGPGVIMGAFIMGMFVYFVIPVDWSWNLCMVFGSILAATDPVAVVALLKSAGASPKLTILIVGESLMNDGTAMVLFTLYFNMLKGDSYGGGDIILYFLKMAIGSPLFGMCSGFVAIYWISLLNKPLSPDDVTCQIAITIFCAYLTFFVAEFEFEMSGLLATCGAGVAFAWLSPPLILEHESMHHVWGILEWCGNTLLFLLAGVIIGKETLEIISFMDYVYLLVLYIFLIALRAVIVGLLYPILSNVGLKCDRNDAKFMVWAGLRGALGMALALIVQSNRTAGEADISNGDASKLFFFVGGIAALTLIINATTAGLVLEYLGLLKEADDDKLLVLDQIRKSLRKRVFKQVEVIQKELHIDSVDKIIKYNSLLREDSNAWEFHGHTSRLSRGSADTDPNPNNRSLSRRDSAAEIMPDLLSYVRTIFLSIVRVEYWHRIEDGSLPREAPATQTLLYSIDNALDRVHKNNLRDWKWLKNEMQPAKIVEKFTSCLEKYTSVESKLHSLGDILKSLDEEFRVYVLTTFIECHQTAQRKIYGFLGKDMHDMVENDFRSPEIALVRRESANHVAAAIKMLGEIDTAIISNITSRQAATSILTLQSKYLLEMVQEGLLTPQDTEPFFEEIRKDRDFIDKDRIRQFNEHVQITASKRISYSQSNMNRSEKEALLNAANGDKGSTSSFFFSNQAPSLITESLLHERHIIHEDEDNERESGFSSD